MPLTARASPPIAGAVPRHGDHSRVRTASSIESPRWKNSIAAHLCLQIFSCFKRGNSSRGDRRTDVGLRGRRFFQTYSGDSRKAKDTALRGQPDRGKIGFDMTLSISGAPDVALWQQPKDGRFE